jgi:hypothetical protein
MKDEFNKWWNEDLLTEDNPYVDGTAAYWAWEGWQAAIKAERKACADLCHQLVNNSRETRFAAAIRARGEA